MEQQEIITLITGRPGNFVASLLDQYKRKGSLSPRQWEVAERIAKEVEAEKAPASSLKPVFDALDKAEIRMARFFIGTIPVKLRRNRAGTSYYLLNGDNHVASVTADGQFRPGAGLPYFEPVRAEIVRSLEALGEDPIGAFVRYGHETGTCAICGRELSDPESVKLGLGPVCLKRMKR
jgi:hypothetical protein